MWYLFFQIWVWLIVAFALGAFTHWFFCCRGKAEKSNVQSAADSVSVGDNESAVAKISETPIVQESWKPQGFASPPSDVDDLKRIKGVGSVIEQTLNGLGIYQFQQLASWNNDNIAWVENFIAFPGRINREDWINQARTLHDGGTTEFANRVDKGDVDYT